MLSAYPYPGNMRQLRHVMRLAGCTAEDGVITDADLDLPPFGGRTAESRILPPLNARRSWKRSASMAAASRRRRVR